MGTIKIPSPNVERMRVTIEGLAPLLQNPITQAEADAMTDKTRGKAEKMSAQQEVDAKLEMMAFEVNGETVHGFNASAIPHGMGSAGFRLGGHKMTEIRAAVRIFDCPEGKIAIQGSEPTIDRRLVSLSGRGSAKIANRPMWYPWYAELPIEYDKGVLKRDEVLRILQDMGRGIGLGAYRPENKGPFGTFEVKTVELDG